MEAMERDTGRMSELFLRRLTLDDEMVVQQAHAELTAEGGSFLVEPVGELAWASYVDLLGDIEQGRAAGRWESVSEIFRIAVVAGEVVGRVAVKPALTPVLADVGGHIGYAVRPRHRRRGHATEILRQSLDIVALHGVDRALLTCEHDNIASYRTIEACGGRLLETRWVEDERIWLRRYEVPTSGQPSPAGRD